MKTIFLLSLLLCSLSATSQSHPQSNPQSNPNANQSENPNSASLNEDTLLVDFYADFQCQSEKITYVSHTDCQPFLNFPTVLSLKTPGNKCIEVYRPMRAFDLCKAFNERVK